MGFFKKNLKTWRKVRNHRNSSEFVHLIALSTWSVLCSAEMWSRLPIDILVVTSTWVSGTKPPLGSQVLNQGRHRNHQREGCGANGYHWTLGLAMSENYIELKVKEIACASSLMQ